MMICDVMCALACEFEHEQNRYWLDLAKKSNEKRSFSCIIDAFEAKNAITMMPVSSHTFNYFCYTFSFPSSLSMHSNQIIYLSWHESSNKNIFFFFLW